MTVDLRGSATGSQFDNHNALYAWPHAGLAGGTLAGDDGNPAVVPRRTVPAAGTTGVKAQFAIGQAWRAVAIRWAWTREATGAGNVKWQLRYGLFYPLIGGNSLAISGMTTVSFAAIAAPGSAAGDIGYALPAETAAIATPLDGFLSTSPIMTVALERLGDDASDTFGGAAGIITLTLTRVD